MGFHNISYKFIAASAITAAKTSIYRIAPLRDSAEPKRDNVERQGATGESSIGVHPSVALNRFYETDLSLGVSESASDMRITEAICSVSKSKNIVKTALVGMSGTIKEYISDGDYDISISVGIAAVEDGRFVDKYPAEGVQALRELLDKNEALYVDSEFLRLFDVTRIVVTSYSIQQMTDSNRQIVAIRCVSDDDYVINNNEY